MRIELDTWGRKAWRALQLGGISSRKFVGGMMVIMGLGRLDAWPTRILADALPACLYGWLLLGLGLGLLMTLGVRLYAIGRVVAGLACVLLTGMVADVGYIGVTSLMEAWMAYALAAEVFTSHDC